jgi:hypothetical protein
VDTYQGTAFEEVVTHQWLTAVPFVLCALAACLAIHSAWFWRRSVTAALALAVPAALVLASGQVGGLIGTNSVVPPLALAVLVIGKNRPPRSWLWIPAAVLIAQLPGLLPYSIIWWWPLAFIPLPATVLLGGLVVTALWFVADARPMIAFCMFLEVICVIETVDAMPGTPTRQYAVIALLPAVLAGAALLLRRRAST